jgi:hypothetical protein
MLVVHLLVLFLPGFASPISTGQVFESKAACEVALESLEATETTLRYACQPAASDTETHGADARS